MLALVKTLQAYDRLAIVMEALMETYKNLRTGAETFIATYKRVGAEPYKAAANAVRVATARTEA